MLVKKVVITDRAPEAIGPYSQAFRAGDILFVSGQIPIDPANGIIPDGIAAQTEQACRNVSEVVKTAGMTMDDVVKTTCFLADMSDFAAFNEVYEKYFTSRPARSCVAVKAIPRGCLCEIEAIATK